MPQPLTRQTLRVASDANAAAYRRAVQSSAPGECWDVLVLTAANQRQASGYRQELDLRTRAAPGGTALFPAIQRSLVVPDPPGRRAGSGGATIGALLAVMDELRLTPAQLSACRILMVHSGGASQRLPMYSPLGKIFAPLPLLRPDGQIATLFDHLYLTLAGLPPRLGPGLLVAAGDVLLLLDHRQVTAPDPGVTALTWRVPAETARHHGVFVVDSRSRILRTLQKVDPAVMRSSGAADASGRVLLDTGLLFFTPEAVGRLVQLGRSRAVSGPSAGPLDLYEQIIGAMARSGGPKRAARLTAPHGSALDRLLARKLGDLSLRAMELAGEFLHLGTTQQFRDAMVGRSQSPATAMLDRNVLCRSTWPVPADARVYHSRLGGRGGSVGHGALVEHSDLHGGVRIGANSVVSQTAIAARAEIGPDRLLFQVPVRMGAAGRRPRHRRVRLGGGQPEPTTTWYAHVLCAVNDDFKAAYAQGECRYLGEPMDHWLARRGISPAQIWPGVPTDERTLWTARLFPVTAQRSGVTEALRMLELPRGSAGRGGHAARALARAWRDAPRMSMAMLLERSDPAAMIEHREVIAARLQAEEFLDAVDQNRDIDVDSAISRFSTPAAYFAAVDTLAAPRPAGPAPQTSLRRARAMWAAARLLERPDHPSGPGASEPAAMAEACRRSAFVQVARASETAPGPTQAQRPVRLRPGRIVTAAAPVRLDLAGGWSDTPPYCYERGGHVVNVAIDLSGQPPVRAVVHTLDKPVLIFESLDLGRRVELSALPRGSVSLADPFAVPRLALEITGLLGSSETILRRRLAALGAGLHISTECRVPKGSGLGTSSILAAALLAALHHVAGHPRSREQILTQTLLLEQRLGSGGGWQDQVGGIIGGVKSTSTRPGVPQRLRLQRLDPGPGRLRDLEQRLVVYFTGQQRLARDILRRVMGRWLARDAAMVSVMDELKSGAAACRDAIAAGRWKDLAREVNRYWRIKRELYPASTTPAFDRLLKDLRGSYDAASLAGAGGGGFAYFVCRDPQQAARLRERLEVMAQGRRDGSLGATYDMAISRRGLAVTEA